MARVTHRCHGARLRTWCSSSPARLLPAWKFSSMVHLSPATARSSPLSLLRFGAETKETAVRSGLDAELGCSPGELELGVDVEFRVSVAQVCFDGAFAEEQVPGDLRR
jgi:hypothetical protein